MLDSNPNDTQPTSSSCSSENQKMSPRENEENEAIKKETEEQQNGDLNPRALTPPDGTADDLDNLERTTGTVETE